MKIKSNHFIERPHTKLGWWSFWLMAAFAVMFLINSAVFMAPTFNPPWRHTILPFYGILMMLCGLCAGIGGLFAIIRRHERSWLVWLTLLPGSLVLFLLLGEFLFPH
jgi:hypothetical protein